MNVLVYDPYVAIKDPDVAQEDDVNNVLEGADILMVCVHLNESTRRMVDDSWFDRMKDGAYFVNTSRGEIVDEDALIKNLRSGKVAAAGLDVISDEFVGDKNTHSVIEYARNNSNLIVTSHVAGLTHDSEEKALRIILDSIEEEL
jgi:phosphoglycerate dehydrogenase-like enzyme